MHDIARHISAFLMLGAGLAALAAPIDEARRLYNEGDYAAAAEKARPLVKRSPRDGNANFFFGASLYNLGEYAEALAPLKVAEGRGVAEAARMLAEYALDNYDADGAQEHLDSWEALLKKGKKEIPARHEELTSRAVQMSNMLDRVERIEIIDSLSVDSATFFNAYQLSAAAGKILPPDAVSHLGAGGYDEKLSTAYMPENHSEILWAAADSSGVFKLYGADILDDGTLDHSAPLDEKLGRNGNALYPFLMPDGMTLYFASDGEGSLGGYDIFMTRRTDSATGGKEYFEPQNIGMPYNSPYNDYMFAIDETSGLGWWATDRNSEPGRVTIYVFEPSAVRVNVEPGDPNLASLARLSDISLTREAGKDYEALLAKKLPEQSADADTNGGATFAIDLGNGKIYRRLADFKNERARSAMLEALAAEASLRKLQSRLDGLRSKYAAGDRSVSHSILDAEREEASLRERSAAQRNSAVRLENKL